MKILILLSRLFVGAVFVFSGFVKAVDPVGSAIKFTDYFNAFSMPWLVDLALPLAMILNALELIVGLTLMLNIRPKLSAWAALVFMSFFTPLTLVLAIDNPVSDCGCFGDFLILTNWETFFKNLIILLPTIFLIIKRKDLKSGVSTRNQSFAIAFFFAFAFLFQSYNYKHLPIFDFRPYKVGNYLPDLMIVPEGMPQDSFATYLYYQKDGVTEEFTMETYPWEDTTWVWVDTKNVLVKEGYHPLIHDLNIITTRFNSLEQTEGTDLIDEILEKEEYVFLFASHDLFQSNAQAFFNLKEIADYLAERNIELYCITSSSDTDIERIRPKLPFNLNFYRTDGITIKTMIRSNPGLLLWKKGTVIDKWHYNDYPKIEELDKILK